MDVTQSEESEGCEGYSVMGVLDTFAPEYPALATKIMFLEDSFISHLRTEESEGCEGYSVMGVLDTLLEALEDGEWHDLNELSTKDGLRGVSMTTLKLSLSHLAEDFGGVELREVWKGEPLILTTEAKLQPILLDFIRRIRCVERSES